MDTKAESPVLLIVEDNAPMRERLSDWLAAEFPDARIFTSATGEEGVALAREQSPDVVLMDLHLPGINGIEATRRIRALPAHARVVILTFEDAEVYREQAASVGACAYVLKDRIATDLIPVIRELLSP